MKIHIYRFLLARLSMCMILGTIFLYPINIHAQENQLNIEKLLKFQTPSDIQVSPDGKWVAYVIERNDMDKDSVTSQIWMTSIDGKTTLPLTTQYADASYPRWSPDGSKLAFLGLRGDPKKLEDAKPQVWLLDRRGGEAQAYTTIKQGVAEFSWSPDSQQMALLIQDPEPEKVKKNDEGESDIPLPVVIDRLQFKEDGVGYLDRRRVHIYLFNGKGDPKQLTVGDYDDESPSWRPDGKAIAFVSKRQDDPDSNENSDIWLVSTTELNSQAKLTQLTHNPGQDHSPAWSPDGKYLTYVTVTDIKKIWYATEHLAILKLQDNSQKVLTTDYDRSVFQPQFSDDGKAIVFLASDGGDQPLMRYEWRSAKLHQLSAMDVSIEEVKSDNNGNLVVLQTSHYSPLNIHLYRKGKSEQLTQLNHELLKNIELAKVQRLRVKGFAGDVVESFVYTPPNYDASKPYPTLFYLHGGPVAQHTSAFNKIGQLYAANGYVAVLPNPHGSNGYGQAFSEILFAKWGISDFTDIDMIADQLVASGVSDESKMGVGGWSYGGILTNYAITKSNRFAAAISGASEVNYRANYGHDIYQHTWEAELGLPWENASAWEAISPFNDLGKISTPTLVIGGQADWNVPIINSEQLYQGLKRRGIPTQLVVYPGETHSITRPSFVLDRYQRFMAWYKRFIVVDKQ
jgi:dipeptidyl aminopeptidase/acylaminoacyl peptidase